ncbi:SNF2 family N-terminal domain-containing protein [Pyrenochaeta sp. MPI-SDFR-AT-0127]|nr:SNF2 family N-terminal domain-containing protein [Pyrenochaeta sp. MPI-SDFR-AT-0127]
MRIVKHETNFFVVFLDDKVLGEVNAQLEEALTSIMAQQCELDFEVFLPTRATRETIGRATKEKDAIVRVQVNVYGSQTTAQIVGREFTARKLYLQCPGYVREGVLYDNPHYLKFPGSHDEGLGEAQQVDESGLETAKTETLKETISDVYSSLTRCQNLKGLDGDGRLKTPLLQHQKKALDFMTQRENGPVPEEYMLWKPFEKDGVPCYRHVVTHAINTLEQVETGGGILADEMGMGKSLSAVMINEWFQEIEKHFNDPIKASLVVIKYHGQNRECSPAKLCNADIVITTYHTLASDFSGSKSPLRDIEWYRLVLDEAHIIRRQSTILYRTVAELAAKSRWCLTGTPIQNRLDDIGSLLAFLRINPFHSLSTFRKFIVIRYDEGGKSRQRAVEGLTRLLDSLCLRRTKDLLHLPDQENRIRHIILSPEERVQYDQTQAMMFRAIRNQHATFDQKSTLGMFQVQLQLRILCNHGTWQQPFSWNRRKLHLLDEREAMEASLGKDGEVTCSSCRQTMPLVNTGSTFRRYTEHCRHVLCSECLEQSMTSGQENYPSNCPLCSTLWTAPVQTPSTDHTLQEDMYFRAEGRSSKMEALMRDVMTDISITKRSVMRNHGRT